MAFSVVNQQETSPSKLYQDFLNHYGIASALITLLQAHPPEAHFAAVMKTELDRLSEEAKKIAGQLGLGGAPAAPQTIHGAATRAALADAMAQMRERFAALSAVQREKVEVEVQPLGALKKKFQPVRDRIWPTWYEILFVFIVIALIILFPVRTALDQQALRDAYIRGEAAHEAKTWDSAILDLSYVIANDADRTYTQAPNLLAESLEGRILNALDAKQYEQARQFVDEYAARFSTIAERRVKAIEFRSESYYRPAQDALNQKNYAEVRGLVDQLEFVRAQSGVERAYVVSSTDSTLARNSDLLYTTSLFEEARALISQNQWQNAQPLLEQLIGRNRNYPGGLDLLRQTYYEQAVLALKAGEWVRTREILRVLGSYSRNYSPVDRKDNDYISANEMERETYFRPAKALYDNKQWLLARDALEQLTKLDRGELTGYVDASTVAKTVDLYNDTFYFPALDALEKKDYKAAQTLFAEVPRPTTNTRYLDTEDRLREAYLTPAQTLADAEDWKGVQAELAPYIAEIGGITRATTGIRELLRTAYMAPAVALAEAKDWAGAQAELKPYVDLFTGEEEVEGAVRDLWRDTFYFPALDALLAGDYQTARNAFTSEPLNRLDYRQSRQWLREAYFRPAAALVQAKEWAAARAELTALRTLENRQRDPNAASYTAALDKIDKAISETYFLPAQAAFDAKDWKNAQALFAVSDLQNSDYRNSKEFLREAYLRPALAFIDQKQWIQARAELNTLLALDTNPSTRVVTPYRNADKWLRETYLRAATDLIIARDWAGARAELAALDALVIPTAVPFKPPYKGAAVLLRESYYRPAQAFLEQGKWAEARAELEALMALDTDPKTKVIKPYLGTFALLRKTHYQPADLLLANGKLDEARAELRALIAIDKLDNATKPYDNSAELCDAAFFKPALALFQAAPPDLAGARSLLEELRGLGPNYISIAAADALADVYYEQALEAKTREDYVSLIELLAQLLEIRPNYPGAASLLRESSYLRATVAFRDGDYKTVRESLSELIRQLGQRDGLSASLQLDPVFKNAATLLRESYYIPAKAAYDQGKWAEARQLFSELVQIIVPGERDDYKDTRTLLHDTYYKEAEAAIAMFDWNTARVALEALLKLAPAYRDADSKLNQALYELVRAAITEGNYEGARTLLRELEAREPRYLDAVVLLRQTYYLPAKAAFDAAQWAEARTQLDQLARIDANFRDSRELYKQSYYIPAKAAFDAAQWAEARTQLDQLARIDANFRDSRELYKQSYYIPAKAAFDAAQWAEARTQLDQLARIDANFRDSRELYKQSYYIPGKAAFDAQNWEAALTDLVPLFRLDQDFAPAEGQPTAFVLLRDSYLIPGKAAYDDKQWTVAQQLFAAAIALGRTDPELIELQRQSFVSPANTALADEVQDWELARQLATAYLAINAEDADSWIIMIRSYTSPGRIALNAKDWGIARENFLLVSELSIPASLQANAEISALKAQAAQDLLDTFYQPGMAAMEAQDWATARAIFTELYAKDPTYKDTSTQLRESYAQPIEAYINNGDSAQARRLIADFAQFLASNAERYPDDATTARDLTIRTYSKPLEAALERGEFEVAAEHFFALREQKVVPSAELDRFIVGNDKLRLAIARRYEWYWRTLAPSGPVTALPATHTSAVNAIAISSGGGRVVSADSDGTIRVQNLLSPDPYEMTIVSGSPFITDIAMAPDAKWFATIGDENAVRVWNTATGQQLARLEGHIGWVGAIAIDPFGALLASGGDDMTVQVWTQADWARQPAVLENAARVSALQFSPDGKLLAVGMADGKVAVWSVKDNRIVTEISTSSYVGQVLFTPDGAIITLGNTNVATLWSAAGEKVRDFAGHGEAAWLRAGSLTGDGLLLATAGSDNQIILWNVVSGEVITRVTAGVNDVYSLRFAVDSSALLAGTVEGRVLVWVAQAR